MAVKISELPSLGSASLNTYESVVPVVANTGSENVTYNTTMANVKIFVEQGDFDATGNISFLNGNIIDGALTLTGGITSGGDISAGNASLTSVTTTGASQIGSNLVVLGNLVVSGNVDYVGVNNVITSDNILELHVANTANISEPWTFDDGKDIGIRFHWYSSQNENAALVFSHDERYLEWYDSGSLGTDTFTGNSYGTFKAGGIILANGTPTTGNATGTLQSHGGASVTGNLWVGGWGNIVGRIDTQGNITTTGNINASSGDLRLNGANVISGAATFTGNIDTTGNLTFFNGNIVNGKMILTNITGGVYTTGNIFTDARMSTGNLGVNSYITVGTTAVVGANATVNQLTVNSTATVGSTLGVTGNIRTGAGATVVGSATVGTTFYVGGAALFNSTIQGASIQNTPIGTVTHASGKFTTLTTTSDNLLGGDLQVTGNITPTANATYDIGNVTYRWANIWASGTVTANATYALYADLAEMYVPDQYYDPGTVVVFGGEQEITVTDQQGDTRVAGAISTQPAYVMNEAQENGVPLALRGKVPVKVVGSVNKGDLLITSNSAGYATAAKWYKPDSNAVFAKSLERDDSEGPRVIWAVIL